MPYKPGGGNHLQFYDESTGEYDSEGVAQLNESDKEALVLTYYFGLSDFVFHWPTYGIHDAEYCDVFVKYSRGKIRDLEIDERKAIYLLATSKINDKSRFLKSLGYSSSEPRQLVNDIYQNTALRTLIYSRLDKNCFSCKALTVLKGKKLASIWELKKDFTLRLITLIPGGDKIWR